MLPSQYKNGLQVVTLLLAVMFSPTFQSFIKGDIKEENFSMTWNVPTYLCQNLGVNFESALTKYDIIFNKGNKFRGDKIVILYIPGDFPEYFRITATGEIRERNGGIPQRGNLTVHLEKLKKDINKLIPSIGFSGLGVIDFEAWRPVFRQHWNSQVIYKNESIEYEKQNNPNMTKKELERKARDDFEKAAKVFMGETLKMAKEMRPNAKWGYYGFPYCMNYKGKKCPAQVEQENDRISWLFEESTALYPSVYMSESLSIEDFTLRVEGRLEEARRISLMPNSCKPGHIHPYVWYKYYDSDKFLTDEAMKGTLEAAKKNGLGGVIIWGSSNDLKTKDKCNALKTYLVDHLGPIYKEVAK